MTRNIVRLALLFASAACATVTDPPAGDGSDNFVITLSQPEFTRREAAEFGIRATVRNVSARDYYANVGDRFNSALDQDNIFAAVGTHAIIERRASDDLWVNANTGVLIEGSRFVAMRAGKSYALAGSIATNASGTYRIRLDYSAVNDDPAGTLPFHDYSPTFLVR